jgi:NAD(P)-dependent dehydrogenase (short-subunit alcohol dehydrogenase family)
MKVAILGAISGMGRALARLMIERGDDIFILGIGDSELSASAADLQQRGNRQTPVGYALCNLEDPETFIPALQAAKEAMGGLDTVVVTAGLFKTQPDLETDREFTRRLLTINFAHTVLFCEDARKLLLENPGGGTLCAFSSVAGDRARKPVVLYGSSKAGLSAYLEGLDHKFRSQGLVTVCIKPGFVKTGMTEGLPTPPFAGEPEQVAGDVLAAILKKRPVLYTPFMWRYVMLVIRNLPRFVMRKIGF